MDGAVSRVSSALPTFRVLMEIALPAIKPPKCSRSIGNGERRVKPSGPVFRKIDPTNRYSSRNASAGEVRDILNAG